jgi:hypothetical protein
MKKNKGTAFTTPNMYGMPQREKLARAAQEQGLSNAALKRRAVFRRRQKEANLEGAYKFAALMGYKAGIQNDISFQRSYRAAKYKGDI